MGDPTSAAMSVDYDPITGLPLPGRSPQNSTMHGSAGGNSTRDPTSAAMSVDYDPITGLPLQARSPQNSTGGFGGGSTGVSDPNSASMSVGYDFLADGSGHNADADGLTALGIEIKERFSSMRVAFLKMDQNRDGRISKKELMDLCRQWNIPSSEAERVIRAADLDHNGTLDFNEFAQRFDPYTGPRDDCGMSASFGSTRHNPADDRPIGGSGARHNPADDRPIGGSGARHNPAEERPIGGSGASKHPADERPIGGSGAADLDTTRPPQQSQSDEDMSKKGEILAMFQQWDQNRDGVIDKIEFTKVLQALGFEEELIPRMFELADVNHDHVVDIHEFINWVYSGPEEPETAQTESVPSSGNAQGSKREVQDVGAAKGTEKEASAGNACVSSMGTTEVLVYGRGGDSKTNEMCKKLDKAGIKYQIRDFDADKGFEEALAASGFSGQAKPPVVCFQNTAWCENPDEKPDPNDMFAVPFADTVAMELRRAVGMFSGANAQQPVRNDATIDEEIMERFRSMKDAFLKVDTNRDGRVSKKELLQKCREWHIPVSEAERILAEADLNHDGTLDFNEFARRFDGAGSNHNLSGSHGMAAHR
eukprot:gnl/MRDRNA2_/MRDRNA2_99640_c0_seq1.p1 gnl/MRDRNA2_/MRDRNA2_99640_c0~~gnl/MRDRNA2_/MRDRNA2_99640_c0_seq1.p1  ORF type:complete len:594 (+),score=132.23 gnl/MRDRNA2_/MRDRNA2_99640_c0_seq1:97-1878(+)